MLHTSLNVNAKSYTKGKAKEAVSDVTGCRVVRATTTDEYSRTNCKWTVKNRWHSSLSKSPSNEMYLLGETEGYSTKEDVPGVKELLEQTFGLLNIRDISTLTGLVSRLSIVAMFGTLLESV